MSDLKLEDLKFEQAMARLEEIVRLLEQGDSTLNEALALFEEGVKLARFCHDQLDKAEAKIEIMVKEGRLEPLEVEEE